MGYKEGDIIRLVNGHLIEFKTKTQFINAVVIYFDYDGAPINDPGYDPTDEIENQQYGIVDSYSEIDPMQDELDQIFRLSNDINCLYDPVVEYLQYKLDHTHTESTEKTLRRAIKAITARQSRYKEEGATPELIQFICDKAKIHI